MYVRIKMSSKLSAEVAETHEIEISASIVRRRPDKAGSKGFNAQKKLSKPNMKLKYTRKVSIHSN